MRWRPTPHPRVPDAAGLGTLLPDDQPRRGGNPIMSSADVEPPEEHDVPEDLVLGGEFPEATREQWRELVAGVLRKSGREGLPEPVEGAVRRTVATGVTVPPLHTGRDA